MKIILQKLNLFFFLGFLLSFTLSIRKVIYFYKINGEFNEYTDISVYLSDIFLILTVISWFFILYNNYYTLSSNLAVQVSKKRMFHVEHFLKNILNKFYSQLINNKLNLLIIIFIAISFLSTFWAENEMLAITKSFKLLIYFFLFHYIRSNVPRGTFLRLFLKVIILLGVTHSVIAILQFLFQKSLGLKFLAESQLSTDINGVSEIIINNNITLRAYGLFPHPNILGGFLVLSIVLTYTYFRMFHVEHSENENIQCSTWNKGKCEIYNKSDKSRFFNHKKLFRGTSSTKKSLFLLLSIQICALLLTFSKSAIIGLILTLVVKKIVNVPRGTFLKEINKTNKLEIKKRNFVNFVHQAFKLFHVKQFALLTLVLGLLVIIITSNDIRDNINKSLELRTDYINVSRETILANTLFGVGAGNYLINVADDFKLESWQYQPVHNVYLLIWSETGIISLIIFLVILFKLIIFKRATIKCSTWNNNKCLVYKKSNTTQRDLLHKAGKILLVIFLIIMFFDHYLWDIQQGEVMLWIIMALI